MDPIEHELELYFLFIIMVLSVELFLNHYYPRLTKKAYLE
jgi:hypothetical protein